MIPIPGRHRVPLPPSVHRGSFLDIVELVESQKAHEKKYKRKLTNSVRHIIGFTLISRGEPGIDMGIPFTIGEYKLQPKSFSDLARK